MKFIFIKNIYMWEMNKDKLEYSTVSQRIVEDGLYILGLIRIKFLYWADIKFDTY